MRTKTQLFVMGLFFCLLIVLPELNANQLDDISKNSRWGEIRSTDTVVNIRSDRSTKSRIVGKLNPEDKVKVDFLKNGWYAIFDIDETIRDETAALGYVSVSLLKPSQTKGMFGQWGSKLYVDKRVNIRSDRTTKSGIVGKLNPGQEVKADFLKNNWYAVFDPDETVRDEATALGYVFASLLKPVSKADVMKKPDITTSEWGEIRYADQIVNIRSGPNKNTRIVGKLNVGDQVKVAFLENNWYAIFDPSETIKDPAMAIGYAFSPLLKTKEPDVLFELEPELEETMTQYTESIETEPVSKIATIEEPKEIVVAKKPVKQILSKKLKHKKEPQKQKIDSNKYNFVGDPVLPHAKKRIFGFNGQYSWVSADKNLNYYDGNGIGDTGNYATGFNLTFGYDKWLVNYMNRSGDWTNKLEGTSTDTENQEYDYESEQDIGEWELKVRYVPENTTFDKIIPYLVAAYNKTTLNHTITADNLILPYENEDTEYSTIMFGMGASIPLNKYIGVRGDISAAYTNATQKTISIDTYSETSGSGIGLTASLGYYWNIYKGLNLQVGTRYDNWNSGSEIGGINKIDYLVVNLGYYREF